MPDLIDGRYRFDSVSAGYLLPVQAASDFANVFFVPPYARLRGDGQTHVREYVPGDVLSETAVSLHRGLPVLPLHSLKSGKQVTGLPLILKDTG